MDEIHSISFFEHIDNFEFLMVEIYRVLKVEGIMSLFVPHFSNPYHYSDYTHKRFFGFYTFYYFSKKQNKLTRKVPTFYNNCNFEVVSQTLCFTSPFATIKRFKKILGKFINANILFQEVYEGHLSNLFSCYGMEIKLKAIK